MEFSKKPTKPETTTKSRCAQHSTFEKQKGIHDSD